MARTCKSRRICEKPKCSRFHPHNVKSDGDHIIRMTLDEYECIRLIDYEGLTQEQCALQMDAARTTIQSIYKSGREKLADSLVNARELYIGGGNVVFDQKQITGERAATEMESS